MIRRVFTETALTAGEQITLSGPEGHHFARVLRLLPGESLVVAAANGPHEATVVFADGKAGTVGLYVAGAASPRDPAVQIHIVQSLAKGDKVEEVIQRCTEIGVAGVCVAPTARSVTRLQPDRAEAKLVRWQRIAAEAAGQAQRDRIPQVTYCRDETALRRHVDALQPDLTLVLDEREEAAGLKMVLRSAAEARPLRSVVLAVGPEGGWDDRDRAMWAELDALPVSIGRRILRTETAGLAGAAAVLYELGELGGDGCVDGCVPHSWL